MVGDAAEHVGEPSLRIDKVELGGADQGVDRRGSFAATARTGKQPGFPPEGNLRSACSAALLVRQMRPSSGKRVKVGQRL